MKITTHSTAQTLALGRALGKLAPTPLCIALNGQLGAGKTHLVRGIAAGAQVADPNLVSSPTYVLLNIYPAAPANPHSKTVFHLDAYRTHSLADFEAVGLDELLEQPAITVIEW